MRVSRIAFVTLCILVCLALVGVIGVLGVYAYFARGLPTPDELYTLASSFQNTSIVSRDGELLYEFFDPSAGLRKQVSYEDISPTLIEAVIATEDPTFFGNPGVNPLSIARAFYQNLRAGYVVSGASTITQQVAKNVFLNTERSYARKIEEAILATELTRTYSKEQILEVYLNESYFGNMAYGVGAASQTYFGKDASGLSLSEAALLAGLLQSPVTYDPYVDPEAALGRRHMVLSLMHRRGYITADEFRESAEAPLGVVEQDTILRAPHMVVDARAWLEDRFGSEYMYEAGLQVVTTLDTRLQAQAEAAVTRGLEQLTSHGAGNAAVVAMDPATGEILAMVGSTDFYDDVISGQINMATTLRQTGSTIKPFTYLAALEQGYTAATMVMDVEQEFADGANPPYKPTNYDFEQWGPVSVRTALACSRNIPAVQVLEDIGLSSLLEMCERLDVGLAPRADYGLSLTLGSGEASLINMTQAFAVLANQGQEVDAHYIESVRDGKGKVVYDHALPSRELVDARLAYIMTDILADDSVRVRAFGPGNNLDLDFPAAVKTGTTNDCRDSWTIGYTADLVLGVWVGNADNSAMTDLSGARGAGLIWNMIMRDYYEYRDPEPFTLPEGIVGATVCAVSGQLPGPNCSDVVQGIFTTESVPTRTCQVHATVDICRSSNRLARPYCPDEQLLRTVVTDFGADWDEWAAQQGYTVPPREVCDIHTTPSLVELSVPAKVSGVVDIYGTTQVAGFSYYVLELGRGSAPSYWEPISPAIHASVNHSVVYRWDSRGWDNGDYSLRLMVYGSQGWHEQATASCRVQN